ncbi:SWC3 [Candida jiufengensis]|uniref:SWC3 n=1 Tax=Candida jiufengensis TaxID=497108 RepID=UPI002224C736|nr:SWC3 [Candida jiufengensis]KAI5951880.1 SWC3 [Candida jiufengensis]
MPPRIRRRLTTSKRNEIEKEQEIQEQSQQIVRPFETIHSFPVSFSSISQKSSLNQPLTIKDTGVLYLSLMKSRSNYLKICPMFQLYWVKQSSYIKKLIDQDKPIPEHLMRDDIYANRPSILSNDVSARDVMIKLIDCGLSIGVHFFEIRIFIAKDERSDTKDDKIRIKQEKIEKKLQKEKEKLERKAQRELEMKEREERKKQKELEKQELLKVERAKLDEKIKLESQPPPITNINGTKNTIKKEAPPKKKETETKSSIPKPEQKPKKVSQPTPKTQNTTPSPSPTDMQSPENQKMIANLNFIGIKNIEFNTLMTLVAHGQGNSHQIMIFQKYIKKAKEMKPPPHSDKVVKKIVDSINKEVELETRNEVNAVKRQLERGEFGEGPSQVNGKINEEEQETTIKNGASTNIKAESTKLAQTTTSAQVKDDEVKQDGNKVDQSISNQSDSKHLEQKQQVEKPPIQNKEQVKEELTLSKQEKPEKIQDQEKQIQQQQNSQSPNQQEQNLQDRTKSYQDQIKDNEPNGITSQYQTQDQLQEQAKLQMQKDLNINLDPINYQNPLKSSSTEPKPYKTKKQRLQEIPKDQKLTAFQEKYLTNATILFEFLENTNVRFQFPKYAICEILDPTTLLNAENGDISDNKDILVSFLWVHNQSEIDAYEVALKEYNDKLKEQEEEKNRKIKEEEAEEQKKNQSENAEVKVETKPEDEISQKESGINGSTSQELETQESKEQTPTESGMDIDVKEEEIEVKEEDSEMKEETEVKEEPASTIPAKRRAPPPRRGKKKRRGPVPRKPTAPKILQPPEEPTYIYSSMSFTIHGIPNKFVPIIVNSFESIEKVQAKMEHILKTGTRLTPYQLWYQVDGRLDEELAENIRQELNQEEKKSTGIPTVKEKPKKYPKKKVEKVEKLVTETVVPEMVVPDQAVSEKVKSEEKVAPVSEISPEKVITEQVGT